MEELQYIQLKDFIDLNIHKIDKIKTQYLNLLSNLTETFDLETSIFFDTIQNINKNGKIIICVKNYSTDDFQIIGSGTIIIEPKIIRGGQNVGHIEDIVVDPEMRGKGITQKMLEILKYVAKNNNCYKVILDCSEEVKKVYMKSGFEIKGIQMAEYFV
jgi:glucosamine-phosphate N-acetyltransferase